MPPLTFNSFPERVIKNLQSWLINWLTDITDMLTRKCF